jgi:hypothetical protein
MATIQALRQHASYLNRYGDRIPLDILNAASERVNVTESHGILSALVDGEIAFSTDQTGAGVWDNRASPPNQLASIHDCSGQAEFHGWVVEFLGKQIQRAEIIRARRRRAAEAYE